VVRRTGSTPGGHGRFTSDAGRTGDAARVVLLNPFVRMLPDRNQTMNAIEDDFGRNFGTVYVHLDPLGIHAESPAKGMDSRYARQMAEELLQAADFFDGRRPTGR
jgi:hypothetical protein